MSALQERDTGLSDASRSNRKPEELDWLIVGGGIHGVHIAIRLLAEVGVAHDRLRIVDPYSRLLDRWQACTQVTGMAYLRSPAVHHLDLAPMALQRFAGKAKSRDPGLFAFPYDRPSLDLFNSHTNHLVRSLDLQARHFRGRVRRCGLEDRRVLVECFDGHQFSAERIVLAVGSSEQPHWPEWAPRESGNVHHIFDPDFRGWPSEDVESVAVVGGGISAAQVALRLSANGIRTALVTRHSLREHQFDSDPGWLGPKSMTRFQRTKDLDRRREMIRRARHRGSIPPDVLRSLRGAINRKAIALHKAEVKTIFPRRNGVRISFESSPPIEVDRLLLATGFQGERPGGEMIDDLVASASLPCANCGFPVVDGALRWHPRVHVTGPLAELELGPTSRNIAGARAAGDRIVATCRRQHDSPQRATA